MDYIVRSGDSLRLIAKRHLGNAARWADIASENYLRPPYLIVVGQRLTVPGGVAANGTYSHSRDPDTSGAGAGSQTAVTLARAMLFVVVREVGTSQKLVRKVMLLPETDVNALVVNHPELFGFHPRKPSANVSPGEHALGDTLSRYISASNKPNGAPNFGGIVWVIDVTKAARAGVKIVNTQEIIKDLDRLAESYPRLRERISRLKGVIDSVEGEVLLDGRVPKTAVQSTEQALAEASLLSGIAKGAKVLGVVGVVFSAYDLGQAGVESYSTGSVKPIGKEVIRQAGGWAGAAAGFEAGFATGALVSVETGPGALLFGLAGGLIFGTASYFGASWATNKLIR